MRIILEQIGILAILSIIGFIAFRLKMLTKDINTALVRLIMRITLPLLMFTTFAKSEINVNMLQNGFLIFFMGMFTVILLYFVSSFTSKLLKLDRENVALHRANSMFGNVVFLGFPLLDSLFPGGEGLLYAGIFQIGHDTLMWTWGIFILGKGANKKSKENWKHLINPVTISFALGLGVMALGVRIPSVIDRPLTGLGHTTIFLSMVYVGAILAQVNVLKVLKNYRAWVVSFNRLLLIPFVLILVLKLLESFALISLSPAVFGVIVLQAGMPCMIIISVIARDLGLNDRQAVENIFISTVLSMGTLPLLYYFIQ